MKFEQIRCAVSMRLYPEEWQNKLGAQDWVKEELFILFSQ